MHRSIHQAIWYPATVQVSGLRHYTFMQYHANVMQWPISFDSEQASIHPSIAPALNVQPELRPKSCKYNNPYVYIYSPTELTHSISPFSPITRTSKSSLLSTKPFVPTRTNRPCFPRLLGGRYHLDSELCCFPRPRDRRLGRDLNMDLGMTSELDWVERAPVARSVVRQSVSRMD